MASKRPWHNFMQWRLPEQKYSPVEAERQAFLSDDEAPFLTEKNFKRRINNPCFWTVINAAIMCISVFANCLRFLPPRHETNSKADAVRAVTNYSPILHNMDIELRDVKFNGTLWPPANPSWMRAEPSEEVDELWEAYEPKDVFAVTADDVRSLGYDPAHVVKFEDDYWGLGDDAYMAGFDMLHKTHCLNELRRMTFEDYGQPKGFYKEKHHGKLWWIHLRHCVDMLMQDQLCHADADVILFHWVDTQSYPWPDLSVTKKCRNWDQMLEWGTSRYVQYDKLVGMTKPKNAHIIPFERGYYEQYGFEDSIFFPNGTGYEW